MSRKSVEVGPEDKSKVPLRILHIFHEMSNGGTGHFVMNYYRHIDRSRIQFDFLTSVESKGYFDDEIYELGGKIYHAYPLKKNPFRNYHDIDRIVRENHYRVVHRHTGSAFGYLDLRAAKKGGAENLLMHAHNTQAGNQLLHLTAKKILHIDCEHLACSRDAGEFLFGRDGDFRIINNAIDLASFSFDEQKRAKIRRELGIEQNFVIGHVGRIEEQKNHPKLIHVFKEILQKRRESILVSVGQGRLQFEMQSLADELNIKDKILFLGARDDVADIMQAFDCFLFPSLYEGLGITLIEAQANGLKCFASKDVIPSTVNATGNVTFIPLAASDREWADIICNGDLSRATNVRGSLQEAGYDITVEARKLANYYLSMQ